MNKHSAHKNYCLDRISAAREAWQSSQRPNDEREGYDYEAMDDLVNSSIVLEQLNEGDQVEACSDILALFVLPYLKDDELDYSWLCVYWRASEYRQSVADFLDLLSNEGHNLSSQQLVALEKYHSEIEAIRNHMAEISMELESIKKGGAADSGVTIGAFGVSVPVETIKSAVSRINQQLNPDNKTFDLALLVKYSSDIYTASKDFLRAFTTSPSEKAKEVGVSLRSVFYAAAEAALVVVGIKEQEIKPPRIEVDITVNPNLTETRADVGNNLAIISNRIEALVEKYDVKVLDEQFFYSLLREFRRFEYLVDINDNDLRIVLASIETFSRSNPEGQITFRLRGSSEIFRMTYKEYAAFIIVFLRDVSSLILDDAPARVNLTKYGGIMTVRRNTESGKA